MKKIAFGALVAISFVAGSASAQTIRFGAGQQGSQNYGVNAALAQAIDTQAGIKVTVQAYGGPTAFLPLINAGELDIAAVVTPDIGDAVRGEGPFKGMAQKNLRLVAPLLPSPVGLMVRKDSGIEKIADLKGKRIAWGVPAQASLQPYIVGALANGGLKASDVRTVPVSSVANGVAALVSGNVDATLFALRGGAVLEADSAVGGIKWLAFDESPEAVQRMQAVAPESYIFNVAEGSGVTGATGAFKTMAYDYVLAARADLDAASVEKIAKLIKDKTAEVAKSNSVLSSMSADTAGRKYPSLPMHDAAKAVFGQ